MVYLKKIVTALAAASSVISSSRRGEAFDDWGRSGFGGGRRWITNFGSAPRVATWVLTVFSGNCGRGMVGTTKSSPLVVSQSKDRNFL
jgi:hypothetical protein